MLSKVGRLDEAEACYKEAVAKLPHLYGEDHPTTVLSVNGYGQLLRKQKKYVEALELLAPREASARRAFPVGNARFLAIYLEGLGLTRTATPPSPDRFPLSEASLLEAHKIYTEAGKPGESGVRSVTGILAQLYKAWDGLEPGKGYDAKAAEWARRAEELNQ